MHHRLIDNGVPGFWDETNATFNGGTGKWEIQLNATPVFAVTATIEWYFEATDNATNSSLNPVDAPTNVYTTTVNYCD